MDALGRSTLTAAGRILAFAQPFGKAELRMKPKDEPDDGRMMTRRLGVKQEFRPVRRSGATEYPGSFT